MQWYVEAKCWFYLFKNQYRSNCIFLCISLTQIANQSNFQAGTEKAVTEYIFGVANPQVCRQKEEDEDNDETKTFVGIGSDCGNVL